MKNGITRRGFLGGLLGGVAAIAAPAILVPERKIWAVGSKLERPEGDIRFFRDTPSSFLTPVEGQPGLFKDNSGGFFLLRDIGRRQPSPSINSYIQSREAAAGWKPLYPRTGEDR